jgi:hypothetical protein
MKEASDSKSAAANSWLDPGAPPLTEEGDRLLRLEGVK